MTSDAKDLDSLREDLTSCRLELAQVRSQQEAALERLSRADRRLEQRKSVSMRLSAALNDELTRVPRGTSVAARAARWAVRRRKANEAEWQLIELLRASPLFNGPWYLRRHAEAARSGMAPALHYLRHGAAAGLDPGPDFSTQDYLRVHPEVARSGVNPLVHHLRSDSTTRSGRE